MDADGHLWRLCPATERDSDREATSVWMLTVSP